MSIMRSSADKPGNVVAVTVMRRETFVIHAESEMERDQIMKSLTDCISFASGNGGLGLGSLLTSSVAARHPSAFPD